MKCITVITMTNTNNPNSTETYVLTTLDEIIPALEEAGWRGGRAGSVAGFHKDRVDLMLMEKQVAESVNEGLQLLFFSK